MDAYSHLEGMCLKVWFSNAESQTWGAVYLLESIEAADPRRLPSKAVELIGYEPISVGIFEVEAIAQGITELPSLHARGRALEAQAEQQPDSERTGAGA